MPHTIVEFQPTPNPNALKCILDTPLAEPIRSFRSPDTAGNDPIARALFAVPGVTSLLLSGSWLTVNKSPHAAWPSVKRGVQAALAKL
jgi:hypothetical protein